MQNIFIVGTRAQLIKVAPVIRKFEERDVKPTILMTGQHKETMDDLLGEFNIETKPERLVKDKEHSSVMALFMWLPYAFYTLIKRLSGRESANIFVHGDTLTTLLSTVAAKMTKHHVVHLESGLTSNKLLSPFPEEAIRRIVFRLTDVACCPSMVDMGNMEKYKKVKALYTHGNTILDSIEMLGIGKDIEVKEGTILVSLHRFQNIYNKKRLLSIVDMLTVLSEQYVVNFVLHPATKKKLTKLNMLGSLQQMENINLLPRMSYKEFLNLALSTEMVITDGGSNQEELAYFGHPTLILRDSTERSDGVGENAILINEAKDIVSFIADKKYLNLTRPQKEISYSPSMIIVNAFTV